MAEVQSPIPPQALTDFSQELQKLVHAQRATHAATLAAAVVSAMGRPVSVNEVLELNRDFLLSLYTDGSRTGHAQEWAKTKDERLAQVRT